MSALNTGDIRGISSKTARILGYEVNDALPYLDDRFAPRPVAEVVDRLLSLLSVVACSYGFDSQLALSWLDREHLSANLTEREAEFLRGRGDKLSFQMQVEALFALAWAVGLPVEMDYSKPCPNDLVRLLPDLKRQESSSAFRASAHLRTDKEIVSALDLAYCLHWAIRQAESEERPTPGRVPPHVVTERRRAFEWLGGNEQWDEVALDT